MKLDSIDLKILDILQSNGRITNAQLATEVGLSPAPTLERVRKLEGSGFIESFHALVNAEKLGLGVSLFIEIKLNYNSSQGLDAIGGELAKLPDVTEVYQVTGQSDFLIKMYANSIADYQAFLENTLMKLNGVGNIESKVVLSTVKRQMGLPLHRLSLNGKKSKKKA